MKTAKANKITNHYNARIVVGILINKVGNSLKLQLFFPKIFLFSLRSTWQSITD